MLKPLIVASAALVLTSSAIAQENSAAKPAVFIATRAPGADTQGSAALSDADTQAIAQLLNECPGIQAAAKELDADYTLRMFAQEGSKNQLQVFNAAGVIVASGLTGDGKTAVKDACNIVLSDFNHNGKAEQAVLAPDAATVPVPALVAAPAAPVVAQPGAPSAPIPAGFAVISAVAPALVAAPLVAPPAPPAAPKTINAASSNQLPPVVPGAGNIHGATVSAGDNSGYQAQPQQQEAISLGEAARRNRAAKAAARQQEQQAQNQPADTPAPSPAPQK